MASGKQASSYCSQMAMLLSESEGQLVEKRACFMERLRNNESKYDSSLGRMSEISKELAFGYRLYL